MSEITKIGQDSFNVEQILEHLEASSMPAYNGASRSMSDLIGRLVRVQQQRIKELEARVRFLEGDAWRAEKEHVLCREALKALQMHYDDLLRRWHLIMERTK